MVSVVSNLPYGDRVDSRDIEAWLNSICKGGNKKELALLRDACELASQVHESEHQDSGETTMRYLLSVADILAGLGLDHETLAAAILHDSLASSEVTVELLRERFGSGVAGMVADMARIGLVAGIQRDIVKESKTEHAENLRRMLLSIADDVRVVLIVLAEYLHDMRTAKHMPEEVRRRVAEETREIYAPLANRLGVWQVKWELEDLSLRYLKPDTYKELASQLDGRRQDRERFIADIIALLQEKFSELGIKAEITGRPKHIYSIWRKMERKAVEFDQIFDLRAVRVLVDSVADCYAVLGVVHGLWRHIPGEFDDYIATPKNNMYQSLHTAVIGPGAKTLEIQVRTHEMHEHAERGVAAHWTYKEGQQHDAEFERRIMLMRNWLELKDDSGEADEFVDRFKGEFEPVSIYALTPRGSVIELPKGSTPVDFAYAIHSDVGHRCRGATVDGRIVPLTYTLESGHTVEIITTKEGGPSRDWISPHHGYIKTARARNRVRQWFRHQDYDQHVHAGRSILEREVQRLGVGKPNLDKLAARFNFQKGDDVLASIGRGELSAGQVAGAMGLHRQTEVGRKVSPVSRPGKAARSEVIVEGEDDLMTNMARCCKPVPPDSIVGYITRGRGVTVHREDCPVITKMDGERRERLISVAWSEQSTGASYPVDVFVSARDRKGLLRDISSLLAGEEVDVVGVSSRSDRNSDVATMRFTLEISNIQQLSRVLNKVAQMPDVIEVRRQIK